MKRIWWYHYNEYSNAGTKLLCCIIMLLAAYGSMVKGDGIIWAGVAAYIALLCDRGFGEPDYSS